MKAVLDRIRRLTDGSVEKRGMWPYLLFLLIFIFSCFLISQLFFPGGYSPGSYYISAQGNVSINPVGSYFFIFGVGITGILLIPYFTFLYRRIRPIWELGSLVAMFGGFVGCIGFSLVGFFPRGASVDVIHDTASSITWLGFLVSMIATSVVIAVGIIMKYRRIDPVKFLLVEVIVLTSGVSVFVVEIPTLSQWMAFITVLLWLIGTFTIIEERI